MYNIDTGEEVVNGAEFRVDFCWKQLGLCFLCERTNVDKWENEWKIGIKATRDNANYCEARYKSVKEKKSVKNESRVNTERNEKDYKY